VSDDKPGSQDDEDKKKEDQPIPTKKFEIPKEQQISNVHECVAMGRKKFARSSRSPLPRLSGSTMSSTTTI
jgi:hypothetical protein